MPRRRRSKSATRPSPVAGGVTRVVDSLPAVGGHRAEVFSVGHDVLSAFRRNRLGTHSTALAYRVLVSLVPLALLGIGLLGAFGLESFWTDSVSPSLHTHLTGPVADAVDYTVAVHRRV